MVDGMESFNFDYWKDLYEKDPYEFETEVSMYLEGVIAELCGGDNPTDKQKQRAARLRGIIWRRRLEYIKLPQPERLNRVIKHFYEDLEEFRCVLGS